MKERGNFWLRFLDRYAGVPVLFVLSLIKGERRKPEQLFKSILVIKIGSIGDTLLLMPVLKAIKETHKEVHLTVIGSKNNYEVLSRYSFIDSLKIFEVSKVIKNPFYFIGFLKEMNSKEYDVIIDFEQWPRISSMLAFFIKSGYKIGFRTEGESKHLVLDMAIPHSSICHEIDNYKSLAGAIGVSVADNLIEFPISQSEKTFVENLLERENCSSDNLILFHPRSAGYKGHLKEWGIGNLISLAELLIKEGYHIGITGSGDDESLARDIADACPDGVSSFCGKFNLGQTAYLIKKSRLLITVNTGIMHLGAALNHPMIALHGPAGILRWGPIGSSNTCNIESDFDCAPCIYLGFEYKCEDGGCMNAIKVETVLQKADEILKDEAEKTQTHSLC